MKPKPITDKELIKETYAASLKPERLADFEEFWESYIDNKIVNSDGSPIESAFIQSHFSMALGIVERIRHEKKEDNYFQQLVLSHPGLAFIVTKTGVIVSTNPDADMFLAQATNLKSIGLDSDDLNVILNWMTQHSERHATGKSPYLFQDVTDETALNTLSLFIAPIATPIVNRVLMGSEQYFLITQVDLRVQDVSLPSIQEKFELTPAEAKVAMYISNGHSVAETATIRKVSVHTVRTQIKSLLAKTETRDIPDMVRLVLTLSSTFNSVKSQSKRFENAQIEDQLTRKYNVILPDGRFMEFAEQGHPFGKPVLQFHCITKSTRLTDNGAKRATLKGWRFITPNRAGFGNSDQNPFKNPVETLDAAANDYRDLLNHLDIDKVVLIGGWGGQFAQKFAAKFPERTAGLLLVGTVPVWHKSHLEFFKTRHRVIVKTAYYAPAAAPYMLRVAKAMIDSGRSRHFVTQVDEERSNDLNSLRKDPDLINLVAEAYEDFFKQGVMPFLGDLKTIITDWKQDSCNLKVPVTVLKGGQIVNKPPKAYEQFQSAVPHARIKTIEQGGIYMRYTHFDRILSELSEFHTLDQHTKLS